MDSRDMTFAIKPSAVNATTDKSWQWVIAFSGFWINLFIFSVFRSAGVLYREFVTTFDCSYREASWPISLAGSIASVSGIATGFLSHYFNIRTLVFIGVFICSFASTICYFATDILFVIISLGIIQGVGIGLVCNLLPAIISEYFGKQRAIACGISYSGATAGAFVFPLFIEWQLKQFGLRGTLLLMGGIILHGLIGALLLRPLNSDKQTKNCLNQRQVKCDNTIQKEPLIEECETFVFIEHNNHQYVNINKFRERPKSIADFDNPIVKMRDKSFQIDRNRNKRMSLPVIAERKVFNYNQNQLTNNSGLKYHNQYNESLWKSISKHIRDDSKIFLDLTFVLCTITYVCFMMNLVTFFIILPDFAGDRGLSEHSGTLLLSLYAITDLFSRLILGWISYLDFLSNRNIYIISIAIMGICFLLMPFAYSFTTLAVLTLICGFVTGCQMVLPAVVLSEYLGSDKTAVAFGLSNFICGVITMIFRPLMIGMIGLKDETGYYDSLFYILGSLAIVSSLLWILDSAKTCCNK